MIIATTHTNSGCQHKHSLSIISLFQAPDLSSGFYDPPRTWIIEFLNGDGSVNLTQSVPDPATTTLTFTDLEKGTLYGAQVAGTNIRGTGAVSAPVTTQTTVDRKLVCGQWNICCVVTLLKLMSALQW